MTSTADNNKRIAKNTGLLYIRMFLTMGISLFTSRILLEALGIDDYGVYNVVGGLVAMFGILNGAMSTSTQRYLTFEIGKENFERLPLVFSTSVKIHYLIALIVFILCETVGLWFFYTQMEIPAESRTAAMWVLQCSILSTLILIISVPYNSTIIAHEKMSAFAYISIIEVALKLGIVYIILALKSERLIVYAILILAVQSIIRLIYVVYCRRHFPETKGSKISDKKLFKEMLSFAGWNLWGNSASAMYNQGLNLLLNVFFGPAVNAARGIAVQVENAVVQFSQSFQTALFPQITKTYAQGNLKEMHKLIQRGAKITFILLFMLSLPIMMEANMLLGLWLKVVPEYTAQFLILILIAIIIDSVSRPIMQAAASTGRVKKYQSIVGTVLLMVVPIAYLVLKLGGGPSSVFVVLIGVIIGASIVRLFIVRPMIGLSILSFVKKVVFPIGMIAGLGVIAPFVVKSTLPGENIWSMLIVMAVSFISVLFLGFVLGFDKSEKAFIINWGKGMVKRRAT